MGSKVRGGGREVKRPAKWVPRSFAFFAKGRVPRRLAPAKLGAVTTMQADGHDKPMVQTASYPPLPRTQERGTLCSGAGREQHGRAGHPPKVANRSTGVGVVEEAGVDLSVHNGHN